MGTIVDKNAWADVMLKAMGNKNPSHEAIKFVQAWEIHESGSGAVIGCDHNPLNLTGHNPGEPNACGRCQGAPRVNTYCSYEDGINATAIRLKSPIYSSLNHALSTNDANGLGFSGHMAPDVAGDLEVWVSGKRTGHISYVNAILQLAGQKNLPSGGDIGQVTPVGIGIPGTPLFDLSNLSTFFEQVAILLLALVFIVMGIVLMSEKAAMKLANSPVGKAVTLA